MYSDYAHKTAKESVNQKYKAKPEKAGKLAKLPPAKPTQADLNREIEAQAQANFNEHVTEGLWYPDYWLSFIALAEPSGECALNSLITGFLEKTTDTSAMKVEAGAVATSMHRSAKRSLDNACAGFSSCAPFFSPADISQKLKFSNSSSSALKKPLILLVMKLFTLLNVKMANYVIYKCYWICISVFIQFDASLAILAMQVPLIALS